MWKLALLLFLALLLLSSLALAQNDSAAKAATIVNDSGAPLALYWINPDTKKTLLLSNPTIPIGAIFPVDSFVGHKFEIREVPNMVTGLCDSSPDQSSCRVIYFEINEKDGQKLTVLPELKVVESDNSTNRLQDVPSVIGSCRERMSKLLRQATDPDAASSILEDTLVCVEGGVVRHMEAINDEIAFQSQMRKSLAASLENYTCLDATADNTPDVHTRVWSHTDGVDRTVHVKFERPASRIHVVENFISEVECKAMEEAAEPKLHRAVVADGKGGTQFSEHRRAMQAGINVPWEQEEEGNPIARLSRRVYDYANHVLGLDIKENGQENLMSIQYFGRGLNDTTPDRYTPHCDGDCNGLPHMFGQRMATMVLYCDVPEIGGHTNFRNAGVHIVPVYGNGIFFSYIDPETKVMDAGFTEHSGCPVFKGQKKIVTQWIRYGVDDKNPWDSFNTLGIKHDAEEL